MATNQLKISYCIVCMNRLGHLKKTLLKNIEDTSIDQNIEFVLLDYNSQDGMMDWVKENLSEHIASGRLMYFRTDEPQEFSHSHSKNMAFKLSTGDILCSINADHFIGESFSAYLREHFGNNKAVFVTPQPAKNYRGPWRPPTDVFGKIAVRRVDFHRTTGFDERFIGYGFEDIDFVNRLRMLSVKRCLLDREEFCRFVPHSDHERYTLKTPIFKELYVTYLAPEITRVLVLFQDSFEEFVIERKLFTDADKFTSAYKKRVTEVAFEVIGEKRIGKWYPKGADKFNMIYDDGEERVCEPQRQNLVTESPHEGNLSENCQKVESDVLIAKLESNLTMLKNWEITKENLKAKQSRVNSIYGSGTIYKNFKREPIYV